MSSCHSDLVFLNKIEGDKENSIIAQRSKTTAELSENMTNKELGKLQKVTRTTNL